MRRRNPSMATWIALGIGAAVGYGVYRAVTNASTASTQPTSPQNTALQNVTTSQQNTLDPNVLTPLGI